MASRSVEHRLLIAEILEEFGLRPVHHRDGRLTCPAPASTLCDVASALAERLPSEILDASRAMISETGRAQDGSVELPSLRSVLRGVERAWLTDILGANRLDTHLQPIVDVTTSAGPFAHECLTRGRAVDGAVVPPLRLFGAADRAALLFHLDRAARMTCIQNAARWDSTGRYFVNFTPTAIYNPAYCLQSTVAAVEDGGIDPSQVTFEVIESVQMHDLAHLDKIFAVYRQRGFTVALDDITGGPTSAEMIRRFRPDYVKIDRSLVSDVERRAASQRVIAAILAQCGELEIDVIAEGIERLEERDWLASAGIRLMQGYLFARPFPA